MHKNLCVHNDLSIKARGEGGTGNGVTLDWNPATGHFDIEVPDGIGPLMLADTLILLSKAAPWLGVMAQHEATVPDGLQWQLHPKGEPLSTNPFIPETAFLTGHIRQGVLDTLAIDPSLYAVHGAYFAPGTDPEAEGTLYMGRGVDTDTATAFWFVAAIGSSEHLDEAMWDDAEGLARLQRKVTAAACAVPA